MSENLDTNLDKSENQPFKVGWTVKEAAVIVDETPNVIRNWLKDFRGYIPLDKKENGYNLFNEESIEVLRKIKELLREQNFSTRHAQHYFATGGKELKLPPKKTLNEELLDEMKKDILLEVDSKLQNERKLLIEAVKPFLQANDEKFQILLQEIRGTKEEVRQFKQETRLLLDEPKEKQPNLEPILKEIQSQLQEVSAGQDSSPEKIGFWRKFLRLFGVK